MKKKTTRKVVSTLLIISLFIVSIPAAFASEKSPAENEKSVCTAILSDALNLSLGNGSGDNGDGGNGNNGGMTLFGNERYKYRTEIRYGSWSTVKTFTVTAAEAKSKATYKAFITDMVSGILGLVTGGFGGVIVASTVKAYMDTFCTTLTDAKGKYTVKRRSATKMQINVLTGKGAILETGYQFQTTHNGKTVTKTLWK